MESRSPPPDPVRVSCTRFSAAPDAIVCITLFGDEAPIVFVLHDVNDSTVRASLDSCALCSKWLEPLRGVSRAGRERRALVALLRPPARAEPRRATPRVFVWLASPRWLLSAVRAYSTRARGGLRPRSAAISSSSACTGQGPRASARGGGRARVVARHAPGARACKVARSVSVLIA
jgi:hypothetical protein